MLEDAFTKGAMRKGDAKINFIREKGLECVWSGEELRVCSWKIPISHSALRLPNCCNLELNSSPMYCRFLRNVNSSEIQILTEPREKFHPGRHNRC